MKTGKLLPLGALLLVSGCGMFKVTVHSSTSTGKGAGTSAGQSGSAGNQAASGGGAAVFTGADAKTVKVKVSKGSPNPQLGKMTVLATLNPKKAGFECGFGDYVSTAPNALITVEPGAENLMIRARSNVAGIMLSQDKQFFCATDDKLRSISDRVSLKPNGLTAGTYELRVLLSSTMAKKSVPGKGYQPQEVDVVLSFGDPSRGQTYDDSVKQISLAEAPQSPLFITGKTPGGEGFRYGDSRCRASYGPMPYAIFESDRPLGNIRFRSLWAAKPFELRMQELPKGDGPAKSEGWCSDSHPRSTGLRNMEGRVAIHLGNLGEGGARPFGFVVLSADTVVDPFKLSPVPLPGKLDIPDRQLRHHFPFIEEFVNQGRNVRVALKFSEKPSRQGSEIDQLRQRLFMEAPKQLFVTPRYDLDKNSTRGTDGDFPKKGETLLIYEASQRSQHFTTFRADGSRWLVLATALVHPDSFSVPPKTTRKFEEKHARGNAGPEDAPLLDKAKAASEKYDKCFDGATAAADRQIEAINNTRLHWTTYNKRRKDRIWDAAAAAAEQRCGKTKLKALQEQTDKDLVAARTQRINDRLSEIAARLSKL